MSSATGTPGQLDIGGVFNATTEIYKKSFGTVWIVALVLLIPSTLIIGLLGDKNFLFNIIGNLVQLAATAWLAGALVKIVQDVEADGRVDMSFGEVLGSVSSIIVPIILLQIVVGVLTFIGYIFCIIPGVILTLMWVVSIPAMVVEGTGIFDSMSRSSDLTRDNRMRILAVGILVFVALAVIFIATAIFAIITPILGVIAGLAVAVAVYPYVSIIGAVLYFRLREMKEGLAGPGVVVQETVIVDEGPINPPEPPQAPPAPPAV